jgi:hypothetical protein
VKVELRWKWRVIRCSRSRSRSEATELEGSGEAGWCTSWVIPTVGFWSVGRGAFGGCAVTESGVGVGDVETHGRAGCLCFTDLFRLLLCARSPARAASRRHFRCVFHFAFLPSSTSLGMSMLGIRLGSVLSLCFWLCLGFRGVGGGVIRPCLEDVLESLARRVEVLSRRLMLLEVIVWLVVCDTRRM